VPDAPQWQVATVENRLIALLPLRERLSLLADCEPVQLRLGAVLCEPGEPMRHVYFPLDCFISLVTATDGQPALEVGMVGREGMLGAHLALGVSAAPLHALVQGAGSACRIPSARFRHELTASNVLRTTMHRYVYMLMVQLATSAACTRFHAVGARLARWLLMSQDRACGDSFHLTQEFLAYMLGVRRVSVTIAAGDLQRRGIVQYQRGEITVLDRAGLEAAACSCYASDLQAYRRMRASR
jgi:CRP-like cAMP-binding protein